MALVHPTDNRPDGSKCTPLVALLVAVAGIGGCAYGPGKVPTAATPVHQLNPAAERGLAFAKRRCGGCHNVGLDDGPPYEGPPFRQLALRYNAISLERRFAEVSEHGFDKMPPISFGRSEAEDLIAYVDTLQAR